ncbi:hypothetical protein EV426DRAFT_703937 [Tirmania nivea]|nr:hypothetical protein EV426DRAFT_703937 [Tirmania nivea]
MLWARSPASAFKKISRDFATYRELRLAIEMHPIDSTSSTETKVESDSNDEMTLYNSENSDDNDDDIVESFWDDWMIARLDWNWV